MKHDKVKYCLLRVEVSAWTGLFTILRCHGPHPRSRLNHIFILKSFWLEQWTISLGKTWLQFWKARCENNPTETISTQSRRPWRPLKEGWPEAQQNIEELFRKNFNTYAELEFLLDRKRPTDFQPSDDMRTEFWHGGCGIVCRLRIRSVLILLPSCFSSKVG